MRDIVSGAEIKTKAQQICRAGDLLVAEIDAKVGGFGIVPSQLSGAVVSSHYFLFDVDSSQLSVDYLGWYLKTFMFQEQVTAQGSTNYAAIRPSNVLSYRIPLPPMCEQERIVKRIESVLGPCATINRIRLDTDKEVRAMLQAHFRRLTEHSPPLSMADVAPLVRRPVAVGGDMEYHELGIRSFGNGTFHKPPLNGMSVGTKKLFWIEPGDLVFNIVFAWEGAVAVAQDVDAGRCGSHRFLTCVPNPELALADFLCFYFLSAEGLEKLGKASPGGAGRNRTLGLEALAQIAVPIPPVSVQKEFVNVWNKVRQCRALAAEADQSLAQFRKAVLNRAFA